jgi:hypothetical protein
MELDTRNPRQKCHDSSSKTGLTAEPEVLLCVVFEQTQFLPLQTRPALERSFQWHMVLSSFVQTSMDLLHKELQACNNDMFLQTLGIRMAACGAKLR